MTAPSTLDWAWKIKISAIKDCPGVVTTQSATSFSYTIPTGVLMMTQDGGVAGVFNTFYVTESNSGSITMTPNSRYPSSVFIKNAVITRGDVYDEALGLRPQVSRKVVLFL